MFTLKLCVCTDPPKPAEAVSSRQFRIPLQHQPQHSAKNTDSYQPDQRDASEGGSEERDNDLSAPTPETEQACKISEPVFLQSSTTNYMSTPGNKNCIIEIQQPIICRINELAWVGFKTHILGNTLTNWQKSIFTLFLCVQCM